MLFTDIKQWIKEGNPCKLNEYTGISHNLKNSKQLTNTEAWEMLMDTNGHWNFEKGLQIIGFENIKGKKTLFFKKYDMDS